MKIFRHIIIISVSLFVMLGVPYLFSPSFAAAVNGTDAVSSASVAIDKPSGEYIVMINPDRHTDSANLEAWKRFFGEGDTDGIFNVFEDIVCTAAKGDPAGVEMSRSFQSVLPENQMQIKTEDAVLMMSKAENGKYDIIIMSKEFADAQSAHRIAEKTGAVEITVKGEAQ